MQITSEVDSCYKSNHAKEGDLTSSDPSFGRGWRLHFSIHHSFDFPKLSLCGQLLAKRITKGLFSLSKVAFTAIISN